MIEITLPYPPTVNNYWRHTVRNRKPQVYTAPEGKKYRRHVKGCCLEQLGLVKPVTGRLDVVVSVHVPDNRKRDLDNVLKALLDSLTSAGVYEDDSQIDRLLVERASQVKDGYVKVEIKEFI